MTGNLRREDWEDRGRGEGGRLGVVLGMLGIPLSPLAACLLSSLSHYIHCAELESETEGERACLACQR